MADDKVAEAADVVARHLLARAAEESAAEDWDLVPEVGEFDWERIGDRMQALAQYPDRETFAAALEYLESRAEHGDP